jgi:hypothetical protein
MQKAFDQMKALMAADVLRAYPNHNKPFHIYTDAANYHLGGCIIQDNIPVAYYSNKLNSAQMNYMTIDKELLCDIATLREFCSMLLGAGLHVHTDQKNILSIGDSSQQHLCWIFYVDEYGPKLHYVEHPCLSRLLRSNVSSLLVGMKATNVVCNLESSNRNESSHSLLMDGGDIVDCLMNLPCFPSRKKKDRRPTKCRKCTDEQNKPKLSSHINDPTIEQCCLNLPEDMVEDNHLDLENIKERQDHEKNSCSLR